MNIFNFIKNIFHKHNLKIIDSVYIGSGMYVFKMQCSSCSKLLLLSYPGVYIKYNDELFKELKLGEELIKLAINDEYY